MHTEDLDYYKLAIFSPFWMINKTGLTLEYKVCMSLRAAALKAAIHTPLC